MKISDELKKRIEPIAPLDDSELEKLFQSNDGELRFLFEVSRIHVDLRDDWQLAAWSEFNEDLKMAAVVSRALGELIRLRSQTEYKPKK